MLPEKQNKENSSDQTKVRVELGDRFLREQITNTTQVLKGFANQNKELSLEVKRLKRQKKLTSVISIVFLLVSLSWFVYATYLYVGKQDQINTPIAIKANQRNRHNLPLPKTKQPIAKQAVKTVQKREVEQATKAIGKNFTPNELLESRLNSKNSYLIPLQKEGFIHPAGDELAISFFKDSSLTKQDLLIIVRNNDTFSEPVQQDTVKANIPSYTKILNKKDFKKGLYYIEIVSNQTLLTLFTGKFTIKK